MKTINSQHLSSIRCQGLNSQPLDHETAALTTRQTMAPCLTCWDFIRDKHGKNKNIFNFHFFAKSCTPETLVSGRTEKYAKAKKNWRLSRFPRNEAIKFMSGQKKVGKLAFFFLLFIVSFLSCISQSFFRVIHFVTNWKSWQKI